MKIEKISSSELPNLPKEVKEIVNSGAWQLYKINVPKEHYLLVTNEDVYILDSFGNLVSKENKNGLNIEAEAVLLFDDLASPVTLSNLV